MDVSLLTSTPVVLGVLTCMDEEQAVARSTGDNNHGVDWGEWVPVGQADLAAILTCRSRGRGGVVLDPRVSSD